MIPRTNSLSSPHSPKKTAGPVLVKNTGPGLTCLVRSMEESRTRAVALLKTSPSTFVRLRHLAGVYCLDSRNHRPFMQEFPASIGQPVPIPSRAFQSVAHVTATHIINFPKSGAVDKRCFFIRSKNQT